MAEARGKCISLGDSFIWLTPHNVDLFGKHSRDDIVSPALVGFETLRALKQACEELSLSRVDIEDIFWCVPPATALSSGRGLSGCAAGRRNNAVRLYGERHAAFLAAHPAPLPVPEPDLAAPVEFFRRNQNGATRIVSDINRL